MDFDKDKAAEQLSEAMNTGGVYKVIEQIGMDAGVKLSMGDFAHEIESFIVNAIEEVKNSEP